MGKLNNSRKKITHNKRKIGGISKINTQKFITSLITECIDRMEPKEETIPVPTLSDSSYETANITSTVKRKAPLSKPVTEIIEGQRVIDVMFFFEQLQALNDHAPHFSCSINNLSFVGEQRRGLNSTFILHCNMCNSQLFVHSSKTDNNLDAVQGATGVGIGFYNSEELFSVLAIPYMSTSLYKKCHNVICDGWELTAKKLMTEAAKEEADYAVNTGRIDKDGVPCITVVADGCWSKRSYKTNYNALSGAAAIVGHQFGKVLYLAVKNKFCTVCCSSATPQEHICYKNYTGSSTGMEAQSIVEGFKMSEQMYGIRYATLIADGDCSTYRKILEARPYKALTVEKIECRNHLLRNYCTKLRSISIDTRFPVKYRKLISKNVLRLRTAITSAIEYRKKCTNISQAAVLLKKDIDNSVYHIFGSHKNCEKYFCKKDSTDMNHMADLKKCSELFHRLNNAVSAISNQSRSLIHNVDSNRAEQFNSIITKFIGGKRINYAKGRSYSGRCHAAVVSLNTRTPHSKLYETIHNQSPNKFIKKLELRRQRKVESKTRYMQARKHIYRKRKEYSSNILTDENYGDSCLKTDLEDDILEMEKRKFLSNLQRTAEERILLEKSTILQAESGFWLEERRKLLTASNFYSVCVRRDTTNCAPLVKKILYTASTLNIKSLKHGRQYEKTAITALAEQENINITPNGLFVDIEFSFLGATPDGLVGNELIVEIKCPISAYGTAPEEAIKGGKIKFWNYDKHHDAFQINKKHMWFYQIQGQLRVTGRRACILGVWTGSQFPMKIEYILKNDDFWTTKMQPKLVTFYLNCLLPELIDPRYTRKMPIR